MVARARVHLEAESTTASRKQTGTTSIEKEPGKRIAFGPVPSRRLGKSLGINNIPPKHCSYSCVYCQLGKTNQLTVQRRKFHDPGTIIDAVSKKCKAARIHGEQIDYLTFVADGEPTLDRNLAREITGIKALGYPVAVITNASLIHDTQVQAALLGADWVSLKVDALDNATWKKVNRPAKTLDLQAILNGMIDFARQFTGHLTTETMLVDGINDNEDQARKIASFVSTIQPREACIAIPTRPPAVKDIKPAGELAITRAYQIFDSELDSTSISCITGFEGNEFAFTGNAREDLLNIMSVHPMRKESVKAFLQKSKSTWRVMENLLGTGEVLEMQYHGNTYYMRKIM
ncbi:radical SAM protein [Candidatus Bathyarchaeota archaeon]|nr:radical SAM protein [Candidatus Bathyarchaeota archaeon]